MFTGKKNGAMHRRKGTALPMVWMCPLKAYMLRLDRQPVGLLKRGEALRGGPRGKTLGHWGVGCPRKESFALKSGSKKMRKLQ